MKCCKHITNSNYMMKNIILVQMLFAIKNREKTCPRLDFLDPINFLSRFMSDCPVCRYQKVFEKHFCKILAKIRSK